MVKARICPSNYWGRRGFIEGSLPSKCIRLDNECNFKSHIAIDSLVAISLNGKELVRVENSRGLVNPTGRKAVNMYLF